jgi:hypothetical protein
MGVTQMTMTEPPLSLGMQLADSRDSLCRTLESRGFTTATAYADSRPQTPLAELAGELGFPFAAVLLERKLVEEADDAGRMDCLARSLLARELRSALPEGWPRGWMESVNADETQGPLFRRAGAFLSVTMALPDAHGAAVERVRRAMETADIPIGWSPAGADDPVLLEAFDSYWPAQSL